MDITPEGMTAAGEFQPISRKDEDLLQLWKSKFRAGAGNMLTELARIYPREISKEDLGERTSMLSTSGTFTTYLGELKRNGLIEVNGRMVKASRELFPDRELGVARVEAAAPVVQGAEGDAGPLAEIAPAQAASLKVSYGPLHRMSAVLPRGEVVHASSQHLRSRGLKMGWLYGYSPAQVAGSAAGQQAADLGAQITRRNLNVQPTVKIPVGYRFNVRVNRDVAFDEPCRPFR